MNLTYKLKLRFIRFVLIPLLSLALLLAPMAPYSVLSLFTGTGTAEAAMPQELPKKKFPDRPAKGQKVEIPEWRSAKSKHFLKDDGYFEVEVSKNSRFYQEKGTKKWLEIDNSLVASDKKGYGYKNKANRFEAQFASGAGTSSVMQLNLEQASMELLPLGIGKGAGVVKDNKVTYPNAFKNTDLVYTVDADVVKEELVLKKADAPAVYTFELKLTNLKYVAKEDGSIEFQYADTSEFAFDFPKPFMYEGGDLPQSDDVKEHSEQVTQAIRQEGDKLLLELKADEAWLQAPEREFPVVIDPTADMTMVDETRISDTFASRNNPTTTYHTASHMYAGNSTSYGESQSYILFPLPGLPDGARVTDAKMKLYNYLTKTTTTNVDVYEVTSGWWPASVLTWNARPTVGQKVTTKGVAAAGWTEFNITSAAKKWYEGKLDNWGLQLTAGVAEDVGFTAQNHTDASYRPVMTLEYWVDPEGITPFWEYTEDGVSPFKGNLFISETDLSLSGRGIDTTISRAYNSRQTIQDGVFGPNWLSALDMRVWDMFGSVAFLDATGTRHIFNRLEYPSDGYTPPAGISLGLKRGDQFWEITTPESTVFYFDRSKNLLRKIIDSNKQTTTFTYDTGDDNWTTLTIKDPSSRITTVKRTNGYVDTVTDPSNRVIHYDYHDSTQGGALRTVTMYDPAGNQLLSYGYTYQQGVADTTNYLLKSITDPKGNVTAYSYDIYDRITMVSFEVAGKLVQKKYSYDTSQSPRIVTVKNERCGITNNDPYSCSEIRYSTNDNGNLVLRDVIMSGTERAKTVYTWSTNNWLVEMKAPNHLLTGQETKHTSSVQYTDSGNPQKLTTPDGKETLMNYDTSDNLIAVTDPMSSVQGTTYDANKNPLDTTDGVGITTMRDYDSYGNLTRITKPMSLSENYVFNSGFEHDRAYDKVPLRWGHPVLQTGEAIEVTDATNYGGMHSLHMKAMGTDGVYTSMQDAIPVNSKMTYSLSGVVKAGANTTAELQVTFKNGDTVLSEEKGLLLTKAEAQAGIWRQKSTLIEAPQGATSAVLKVMTKGNSGGVGEAWFDNLIFEGGTGRSGNILNVNYSFDHDFDKTFRADGWYPYSTVPTSGISIYYGDKYHGIASEQIKGDPLTDRYVEQNLILSGVKGTKFNLSGWGKQIGASTSGTWEMQLVFYKADLTEPAKVTLPFGITKVGWQHQSKVIEAPVDFTHVGIKLLYGKMPSNSYALFDDVRLTQLNSVSSTISQYNYIDNTSFEYNYDGSELPDGWYVDAADQGNVKIVGLPQHDVYSGEKALQVTAASGQAIEANLSDERIPFKEDSFTLVGYIKTEGLQAGAEAMLYAKGFGENDEDMGAAYSESVTGTKGWTRVKLDLSKRSFGGGWISEDIPDTKKFTVGLVVLGGTGTAYFDNVRLQEGVSSIDYSYGENYLSAIYDEIGRKTDYTIDPNTGYIQSVRDHAQTEYGYTYDFLGRLKQYAFPYQGALGNTPVTKTHSYDYDANGNLTSVTSPEGQKTVSYTYEESNRVTSYTESVTLGAQTLANQWKYTYDEVGRMDGIYTPGGRFNIFSHDMAGRLKKLKVGNNGLVISKDYLFAYDPNGNMTSFGVEGMQTTRKYDNMNRLINETEPTVGNMVDYTYDHAGKITKAIVKSGNLSWTSEFFYDSMGRPKGFKDGGHEMWLLFDESGNKTKMYYSNGMSTYYGRDRLDRITNLMVEKTGVPIAEYQYEYDSVGNLSRVWSSFDTTMPQAQYEYDKASQLLKETYQEGNVTKTVEYQYDELGNRVKKIEDGVAIDYTYNAEKNRLMSVGDKPYQYDQDGNVLNDGSYSYGWDDMNKLARASKNGQEISFKYDVLGRRTSLENSMSGLKKEYHYNGNQVAYVRETDSTGTKIYRFAYDHAGHPVFMNFNNTKYWYHYDANGNVVFLTDSLGEKVAEYQYDAWGNMSITINKDGIGELNPYRYASYWYDKETEKYYLNARIYDPKVGRFLSKDPVGVVQGSFLGLNTYVYGANNPLTYVDPSGLYVEVIEKMDKAEYNEGVDLYKQEIEKNRERKQNQKSAVATTLAAASGTAGMGADDMLKKIKDTTDHETKQRNLFITETHKAKRAFKVAGKVGGGGFVVGMIGDRVCYQLGYCQDYHFGKSFVDNFVITLAGVAAGAVLVLGLGIAAPFAALAVLGGSVLYAYAASKNDKFLPSTHIFGP